MSSFESHQIDRRTLLFASLAAARVGAATYTVEQSPTLETLTQWLNASLKTRRLALGPCLDRIRELDSSIHAWAQVSPQRPTGRGKLSEIPFGVKDIIETLPMAVPSGFRLGCNSLHSTARMPECFAPLCGWRKCSAGNRQDPADTSRARCIVTQGGRKDQTL